MIIVELLYFLVVCYIIFYAPGRYLLASSKITFPQAILMPVSLGVGVGAFLFTTYILRFMGIDYIYVLFALITVIILRKTLATELKNSSPRMFLRSPYFYLITIGSLFIGYITGNSGKVVDGELIFYGQNAADGIYHVSLIKNLLINYPLHHPGLAEIPLRGYHFFYDLLIAHSIRYFHFDVYNSVFRLFPIFIAFLYGLGGYALITFYKTRKLVGVFFIFLLYFSQSLQFFYFFLFADTFSTYNSGIIQGFLGIINPSVLLSVGLLFIVFILSFFLSSDLCSVLFGAALLGIISQIKIHTFFLGVIALGAVGVFVFVKRREVHFLKAFCVTGIVSSVAYLPTNFGAGGLLFAPFLLYTHFMEGSSFTVFPNFHWALKLQTYLADNNYLRVVQLYLIAIGAFFIPTLGVRLISVLQIRNVFSLSFYTAGNTFWIVMVGSSLFLSSFFIQSVGVFNIIQFLWISYTILLLPTAYALASICKNNTWKAALVFSVLIVLFLPEIGHALKSYSQSPYRISRDLQVISSDIEKTLSPSETLLVLYRSDEYLPEGTPVLSALSGRGVFYEPELTAFTGISQIENTRIEIIRKLEEQLKNCEKRNVLTTKKMLHTLPVSGVLALKKPPCEEAFKNYPKRQEGKYHYYTLK